MPIMFIRVKSTPNSPRKSVQIVESYRVNGKVRQRIVKHIGIAHDKKELEELKALANSIKSKLELDEQLPLYTQEEIENKNTASKDKKDKVSKKEEVDTNIVNREDYNVNLLDIIEEDRIIKGIHDIYGKLYDEIGFNKIIANPARNKASNRVLKEIVLARIANPDSKRASVVNLEENFGVKLKLEQVYKMMDKIDDKAIIKLNKLVYNQTSSLLREKIDILYFDATTLYFESFDEDSGDDAIRKKGFSKDGKFNQPQVVLALLVTKNGLPIGYKAFSGNTFDGHTLTPTLQEIKEHYDIDNIVFVADSGMFSKDNLKEFEELKNPFLSKYTKYQWSKEVKKLTLKDYNHQYKEFPKKINITYIVGARIKNMPKNIKKQILDKNNYKELNDDIKVATFDYQGKKLVVTYSKKRAKKDKFDREKGIEKLQDRLEKDKSVKSHLSHQGYKKYLQLIKKDKNKTDNSKQSPCDISIELNEEKIKEDEAWDGLKGIITNNSDLSNEELIHQYSNLWQIEESFRITKHDLKIRPIYHWKPSRVKAHLAISFMAYTLVRYLEHRVRLQYIKLSPQKIRKILLSIQVSILYDTKTNKKFVLPSKISIDAKKIYKLMEVPISSTPYILCSASKKRSSP